MAVPWGREFGLTSDPVPDSSSDGLIEENGLDWAFSFEEGEGEFAYG